MYFPHTHHYSLLVCFFERIQMFFLDRDIVHSKNTLTVFYQSQSACATLTSIFFASNQILHIMLYPSI